MFVKHYAPLGAMMLVVFGHLYKIGMDKSETIFQLQVTMTLTY